MSKTTVDLLAFALAGEGLQPIVQAVCHAIRVGRGIGVLIAMLTTMAGVAAAPWLLPRLSGDAQRL